MLFRSTGLGKTELTGHIVGLERQGDYLLLQVDVTDPSNGEFEAGCPSRIF